MKKTILYIAASTFVLGFALTNCSKKSDPAPAASTSTTGTTTTGTTTTSTTAGSTTSATTAGSTTSSTTSAKTNNLTLNTWEVVTKSSTTLNVVNQAGFTDNVDDNTRTYTFGANIGTSSPVSLNFTFAGKGVMPPSGIYKMIDFVSGSLPKANEVIFSNGGFGGGYSKLDLNSSILVTNSSSKILIETTGASIYGFTGTAMTLNAKVQQ